ncbi:MAG: hypothetical protein IH963_02045 [Chloroflexi bacterium]|nr:hypothetical protein [Chloroflexota bacterium]
MKFSLNSQANNINGTATQGTKSVIDEAIEMKNANTNIQMNIGNSGALVIKNTARLLGGLAVAAMVAMAATFGSVSADSPSVSSGFVAHGPNEMDIEYLNKLGNNFLVHDYDAIQPSAKVNNFLVHDYDAVQPSAKVNNFLVHDYDAVQPSAKVNNFLVHDYDAVQPSAWVNNFYVHGPDTSEWTG